MAYTFILMTLHPPADQQLEGVTAGRNERNLTSNMSIHRIPFLV